MAPKGVTRCVVDYAYLQHFSGGLREDGGVGDLCGQVLQDCLQPLQIHQHSRLHILHEQEERREEKREGEEGEKKEEWVKV